MKDENTLYTSYVSLLKLSKGRQHGDSDSRSVFGRVRLESKLLYVYIQNILLKKSWYKKLQRLILGPKSPSMELFGIYIQVRKRNSVEATFNSGKNFRPIFLGNDC